MRLYEVGGSEVRHPTQQVELAIPQGDQGVPAEDDGLAPVSGLGELGEHDPGDAGLDNVTDVDDEDDKYVTYSYKHANDALNTHHKNCHWTLSRRHSSSVSINY